MTAKKPEDRAEINSLRLERLWEEEKETAGQARAPPNLRQAVWRFLRTRTMCTMVLGSLHGILFILEPTVMLKLVLDYISSPVTDYLRAGIILLLLAILRLCQDAIYHATLVMGSHTGARVTGGVQAMVHRKALRLRCGGEKLAAQVVSICNNDVEQIFEACIYGVLTTSVPVTFLIGAVYSIYILGPWALMGLAIFLLFFPLLGVIAESLSSMRLATVQLTNMRLSLMTEAMNAIRFIKMYAWETSFVDRMTELRQEEVRLQRRAAVLQALSSTLTPSVAVLAIVLTLVTYTLAGNSLSAVDAFTVLSAYHAMQYSIFVLPHSIRLIAEAAVCLRRIQTLMELPEHQRRTEGVLNGNLALVIRNASYAWQTHNLSGSQTEGIVRQRGERDGLLGKKEGRPVVDKSQNVVQFVNVLLGVNVMVRRGQLMGVCGDTRSGKSSLISAICGEMILYDGHCLVNGKLALVTQRPWIYNHTLQDNILMGKRMLARRYQNVLWACSLESSIELLPDGDMTEIGVLAMNLSEGEKQKVNLARAVYYDRDVYLLDDPLSAVDTEEARHIFNKSIMGMLAQKTVILVTHTVNFLKQCDKVLVLRDGQVAETGTHEELMTRQGEYCQLMHQYQVTEEPNDKGTSVTQDISTLSEAEEDNTSAAIRDTDMNGAKDKGRTTLLKQHKTGTVHWRPYLTFIMGCSGWCSAVTILLVLIIYTLSRIFHVLWLQIGLDQVDGITTQHLMISSGGTNETTPMEDLTGDVPENMRWWFFQLVFAMGALAVLLTGIIQGLALKIWVLAGSTKLHAALTESIMAAPIRFFDAVTAGRILARFGRDLDEVDVRVPYHLGFVLEESLVILAKLCLVCSVYIWYILPTIVITGLLLLLDVFMNAGARQLKHFHNTFKAQVAEHVSSSVSGLSVVRTFNKERLFIGRTYQYLDQHLLARLLLGFSSFWLSYRMSVLSLVAVLTLNSICVLTKGLVSTASAGVALVTLYGVCTYLPLLFKMKTDFLCHATSVQRIIDFIFSIETEAPRELPGTEPQGDWPTQGAIELRDVQLRFRPDLPPVLQGVTASIRPGEKVGIVGMNDSERHSLTSALLRLCELDAGTVVVDGVDVSTLGLHTLRSNICVIPQDPVLFQGTLRYNLDPYDEYTDVTVWEALDQSGFSELVSSLEMGLDSKVERGGHNFSMQERRMICLIRALLRDNKILLLDEMVAASEDRDTEVLMQFTIQENFADCTILTVTQHFRNIAIYDRVLVLQEGRVAEFDTPENLLMSPFSVFRSLMEAKGITTLKQVKAPR